MKLLCVSDHIDPLVYSPNIKSRFGELDMVISAGDLPMSYLGFLASSFNQPVLFVFGNHNLDKFHLFKKRSVTSVTRDDFRPNMENYFGSTHVSDQVVRVKNLLIAGLGGSMRYNSGENQFTDVQMYIRIFRLIPRLLWNKLFHGRYLDILLTHAAPRGIHDKPDACHTGFKSFLWFMRTFKPSYLLHGHIHLYDLNANRETTYYRTRIINVYDHYLLNIEGQDTNE